MFAFLAADGAAVSLAASAKKVPCLSFSRRQWNAYVERRIPRSKYVINDTTLFDDKRTKTTEKNVG